MRRLSVKRRNELKALARTPDKDINLSDIPEIKEIPTDHVVGRFYRPGKTNVTIRLDSDVVAWLRASGKDSQSSVNGYLRQLMRKSRAR